YLDAEVTIVTERTKVGMAILWVHPAWCVLYADVSSLMGLRIVLHAALASLFKYLYDCTFVIL
ncbi:unnamed protein product, partial [marine sediment metagenome]